MKGKILFSAFCLLSACASANPARAHPEPNLGRPRTPSSSPTDTPKPSPTDSPGVGIFKRRVLYQCDDKGNEWMKKIEAQAWADAGAMVNAAGKWNNKRDNALQPLADYWFGNDSINKDNAKFIKDTFSNQKKIHNPNWIFPEAVVSVYCGEHPHLNTQCKKDKKNPRDPNGPLISAFAKAWVERGGWWNTYVIVLCPRFFEEKYSVEEILKGMSDGKLDRNDADNLKKTWASTYVHELTHLDPVIAPNVVADVVYYACESAKLALWNGFKGPLRWIKRGFRRDSKFYTSNNAENFGFFAAAALFKKLLGGEPLKAKDTCELHNPSTSMFDNFFWKENVLPPEAFSEEELLPPRNRDDGTFNYLYPPEVEPAALPADDGVVPLPETYKPRPLPTDLARPYSGAYAYFASRTLTSEKTYPPTTIALAPPSSIGHPGSSMPPIGTQTAGT